MRLYVMQSMEDNDNVEVTTSEEEVDRFTQEEGEFAKVWVFSVQPDGSCKEIH